jgi:hypothetical protein
LDVTDRPRRSLEERLLREAEDFARRLSVTVRAAFGDSVPPFAARTAPDTSRLTVRQDPRTGIVLSIDGIERLRLTVEMRCVWDHAQEYLAVDASQVSVEALAGSNEPLFRYEYLRSPMGRQASAHIQLHAHRDAMTYVMALSGDGSARAKRRRQASDGNKRIPQLSDLHFPVGGARYRPCLEDVLQTLVDEFGVDVQPGAIQALEAGRERRRIDQLASCVRDAPETAARVLERLGYRVEPPAGGHHPNRTDKLRLL